MTERCPKRSLKPPRETSSCQAIDSTSCSIAVMTYSPQDLLKKVRSILNKMTPEKFPQLMKQVKDLPINTEERLKGVVDLVFEKAIDEPSFSVIYGNMCRCLAELKVPTSDDPNVTVSFIKLLRIGCKKEFDKYKEDDVVFETKPKELDSAASTDRDRLQVELQEAEGSSRRRSVGNVKFIGELFKLQMLTTANIEYCVGKMLENPNEKSLECLCTLLTTIGRSFDLVVAKPVMDQYFTKINTIVTEGKTSSRIRFMLEDIIDLRLHKWVPRKADQGPKTLEQIHRGAMIEEQEDQKRVQHQLLSKDTKRKPVPSKQLDQRIQREGPWKSVSVCNNSRAIDPNEFPKLSKPINLGVQGPPPSKGVHDVDQLHKSENAWKPVRNRESLPVEKPTISSPQLRPQLDEKIQLGPRAQVTWVKGSGGGAQASDSGEVTPPPHPSITPPQKPVFNAWSTLEREREGAVPQRQSVSEQKPEPESKRIPEPVKPEPVVQSPKENKLQCSSAQSERLRSPGEMGHHVEKIPLEDMSSGKHIFNCVKEKVDKSQVSSSPYLRELMTAMCKAAEKSNKDCRVHAALLQKRSPLVLKYRNTEGERQQQALDELQALIVALDEPPDLLRMFFACHCDEDVISEYAYSKYGIRKDTADLMGKDVALKSVTEFFTWLREAESEDNYFLTAEETWVPDSLNANIGM